MSYFLLEEIYFFSYWMGKQGETPYENTGLWVVCGWFLVIALVDLILFVHTDRI